MADWRVITNNPDGYEDVVVSEVKAADMYALSRLSAAVFGVKLTEERGFDGSITLDDGRGQYQKFIPLPDTSEFNDLDSEF